MNERKFGTKILAILLILSLLMTGTAFAQSKTATISANNTPMRASTKSGAKLIAKLDKGAVVTVLSTKGSYSKVSYKGKTGFVKKSALKETEVVKAEPKTTKTIATTAKAVLYASSKISSKKLKSIAKGQKVGVVSDKGKWKKVTVSGKTGYMLASAFEALPTPTPKATQKTEGKLPDELVAMRDARMYQRASTRAKSVKVENGKTVKLVSQKGKWSKVKLGNKGGYMLSSAFTDTVSMKTKLYQSKSTKAKSVALKSGVKVSVISQDGDWTQVMYGKNTGYVKTAALAEPTPTPQPSKAASVQKTTVKAYMYQKPSTSAKHVTVKAGSSVTVISEDGKWMKVKFRGKGGYIQKKAFEQAPDATPAPAPSQTGAPEYKTLRSGSKGDAVKKLELRLEQLGYMDAIPDTKYGAGTVTAVKTFQGNSNLKQTGVADNATQKALYETGANKSSILSASLNGKSKGSLVKRLQVRLREKGFFKGKISGSYGEATEAAVKGYQAQAGLTADGVAGKATLTSLFSGGAPAYGAARPTPTPVVAPTPTPTHRPTASVKPTPIPTRAPVSSTKKSRADTVISAAMSKLGKPYVFGATGPNSYDCSGFTMYAYGTVGVSLPHSAYLQGYFSGEKVSMSQLVRGDLVCWDTVSDSDLSDHVGIYLGNGQAIHASSGTGKVIISSITSGYYQRAFSWGRSLL